MNNQYLITQKLNEYKEFKRKMMLISQSLTDGLDHLKICVSKLSNCYEGYGDGVDITRLSDSLSTSKNFIVDRIIPEIDLQIKNLSEQLNRQ